MIDALGGDTDDIEVAAHVVAGPMPDGRWLACSVDADDLERLQ
jgi:hypothetical protein